MIEFLTFTWSDLLHPEFYIHNGGLWLFLFIVFAETGLFAGFFLPGDSLLFVAGIYSTELLAANHLDTGSDLINLLVIIVMVATCGILGNFVGYWFGRKTGPYMFHWKDNLLFKQKYLYDAHEFYDKHGGVAVVFARFLPVIRTFAPIIAGIVKMDRKRFTYFNIIGCAAWSLTMLVGGHYLQRLVLRWFHFDLKDHLEVIVIGIVVVTTAPVLYKLFFGRRRAAPGENPAQKS
jgi:membrane-associated protein